MKILSKANIYMFLWCLYYSQGILYAKGSIISQGLLAILLIISLFHTLKVNINEMPKPLKWIDALLITFIIYGLVAIAFGNSVPGVRNVEYIKSILVSFLPVYSFYYYTQYENIDYRNIRLWSVLLLLIYIGSYYFHKEAALAGSMGHMAASMDTTTNNAGYLLASIVPLIIVWKRRPIVQYIMMAVVMIMVLLSMKRGAILISVVGLVWLLFITIKSGSTFKRFVAIVLSIGLVCLCIYYVGKLLATSAFFNYRIQQTLEGDDSLRSDIYSFFSNYFIHYTNPFTFLFGSGANATVKIYGAFAHNDWLELAINQGLLGLVIYVGYWISQFKAWHAIKGKENKTLVYLFGCTLLILFFKTFVSMSYGMIPISLSMVIGYSLACIQSPQLCNDEQ